MLSNLLSTDVVMQPIVAEGATTAPNYYGSAC